MQVLLYSFVSVFHKVNFTIVKGLMQNVNFTLIGLKLHADLAVSVCLFLVIAFKRNYVNYDIVNQMTIFFISISHNV